MYMNSDWPQIHQIQHLWIPCCIPNNPSYSAAYNRYDQKSVKGKEEMEGIKTDTSVPITEDDASAHKTQTPEHSQFWDQFLKPGFPQTRRKDLKPLS